MSVELPTRPSLFDCSPLLPRDMGVLKDSVLSQWTMLRANGKALKAAVAAETRGYLRSGDAPKKPSVSEKLYGSNQTLQIEAGSVTSPVTNATPPGQGMGDQVDLNA